MAKSLEELLREMELKRIQKIEEEKSHQERIRQQNEKLRQEWTKSNLMFEKSSSVSPNSSSSAGGGSIREKTIPIVEIVSFDPSSFAPTINSITINVNDGGSPVTERGIIYGLNPSPDLTQLGLSPSLVYQEISGSGSGQFTMTDVNVDSDVLMEVTYLRAYAINDIGVGYSEEVSWTPEICLAKGTKILLSTGFSKNIEDIEYEDKLMVWNFDDGKFDTSNPLWIKKSETTNKYNVLKFSDGSELKTISQHRIFNKEAGKFTYPMTDETPIGTTTFNESGKEVILIEKSVVDESVEYYNVISNIHMNLFANGILTSCRYNNIYPIQDMKFVKENRSRNVSEFVNIPEKYISGLRLSEQMFSLEEISSYVRRLQNHEVEVFQEI